MKRHILSFTVLGCLGFAIMGSGSGWGVDGGKAPADKPVSAAPGGAVRPKAPVAAPQLVLEQKQFAQGTLYVLTVPASSDFRVKPFLASSLAAIDSPVWRAAQGPAPAKESIFLLNGGFFDPNNGLTTSFVFQKGSLVGDPRLNPQLVNNPKLAPYLPKVFNRPEFRSYLCEAKSNRVETRYDIVLHNDPIPEKCLLQSSLGAGPTLLPKLEDYEQGFVDYNAQGKLTRDPIGVCAHNARSVIGLTPVGDIILMMAAQNPKNPQGSGFSLPDMAALLKARGATKAMALDGGSSSSLLYGGKAIYGRLSKDGSWVKRPVKSVMMVVPQ